LVKKFGNEKFVDLGRNYHSYDGDKYVSEWPGTDETIETTVTSHSYENRVQASSDVFNFPEVDTSDIRVHGLYGYPKIHSNYKQDNLLGNTPNWAQYNFQLEVLNGKLGKKKQLKTFVLLFKNKTRDAGFKQEALWKGGNKNEYVLCIGVDDNYQVDWVYPFSWSEAQITKVNIRTYVEQQDTLDLGKTIDYMYTELDENFVRKQFADFDYLTIDPTDTQLLWTYIFSLLVTIGLSVYFVLNEFDDESPDGIKRYRYRSYRRW
jgi:hypothetical protein